MNAVSKWIRAASIIASVWAVAGVAIVAAIATWAALSGKPMGSRSDLLFVFGIAGGVTFGAGLMFAVSVSLLGRVGKRSSVSLASGAAWGSCAGAAIAAAAVLATPGSVEPSSAMWGMAVYAALGATFAGLLVGIANRTGLRADNPVTFAAGQISGSSLDSGVQAVPDGRAPADSRAAAR